MNDDYRQLTAVLARVRTRWRTLSGLSAMTKAVLAGAGLALAALVAYLIAAPGEPGVVILFLVPAVGLLACGGWFIWTLRRRPDDRTVARLIEERCPELEDGLATAVELGGRTHQPAGASVLLAPLIADALSKVSRLDLDRVIPSRLIRRAAMGAGLGVGVLLAVLYSGREPGYRALEVAGAYLFPSRFAIQVEPGDLRLRAGRPLLIHARLSGATPTAVPVLELTGERPRRIPMKRAGRSNEYAAFLESVTDSFKYKVTAGSRASDQYSVEVIRPPRVARIDLEYRYPAATGLAPRVEEDGGDVYGPAGTRVELRVRSDRPVNRGELKLADGSRVALTSLGGDVLSGEILIGGDGSYRVALADRDGLENPGDTEYFIRTLDDRPPDVRIIRPAGDRQVTRLEEVAIEARADDDYGLGQFDLVYSVRGGPEKTAAFRTKGSALTLNGSYTLYLEELSVAPGDFVTYYARARDVSKGRRPAESRSDIFFIEIKPYDEEFVSAQSQASMGGGGGGALDDLVGAQKDIIVATWKLDRRSSSGRSQTDIQAVARAQGELKARVAAASDEYSRPQTDLRWRRPRPGQGDSAQTAAKDDPMGRAVEAMSRAEAALERLKTADALPPEMDALNQLLKAQAEVRRKQVARQQANGASGGSGRADQDLSSLFDRELQRQQQTNYETPTSSETRDDEKQDEALAKIRELARRQDELNQQQRDLAERQKNLSTEELRRQLERLTRDQSELRRLAEELSRSLGQQQSQSKQSSQGQQGGAGETGSKRMGDITEEMRNAASELRRQAPAEASARGGRALEKLRDLERRMASSQPDDFRRAAGDLQLEARQIAEGQRQVAEEMKRMGASRPSSDGARRVAGDKERLAERAAKLEKGVKDLSQSSDAGSDSDRTALDDVNKELDEQQLSKRMRESAEGLRQSAAGESKSDGKSAANGSNKPTGENSEVERQVAAEQELARVLDRVADKLGAAGGSRDAESRKLAEQLARARELRDRLNEIDRKLADMRAERPQGEAGTRSQQSGAPDSSGKEGRVGEKGSTGGGGAGELARLEEEVLEAPA